MTYSQFPCPSCQHGTTKVRNTDGIKRRRECLKCKEGFTTYEVMDVDYRFMRATIDMVKQKASDWLPGKHGTIGKS